MEKEADDMELRPSSAPATPYVYLDPLESHKMFRLSTCLGLRPRESESVSSFHGSFGYQIISSQRMEV